MRRSFLSRQPVANQPERCQATQHTSSPCSTSRSTWPVAASMRRNLLSPHPVANLAPKACHETHHTKSPWSTIKSTSPVAALMKRSFLSPQPVANLEPEGCHATQQTSLLCSTSRSFSMWATPRIERRCCTSAATLCCCSGTSRLAINFAAKARNSALIASIATSAVALTTCFPWRSDCNCCAATSYARRSNSRTWTSGLCRRYS
mmetsp:Transcript_137255/g.347724  ORF Transcript_137255/g.347724 Transcript_137255/m.347724 type:complete len:205 (-) Transcript_137255:379-993(-)